MSIPMIITETSISFVYDNKPHFLTSDHMSFSEVKELLREGRYQEAVKRTSVVSAINSYVHGHHEINEEYGTISYKGHEIHGSIVRRIFRMKKEGFDCKPLLNFLSNLMENPSYRAVHQLYDFLEYGKMPITSDGHFLAYKRVRSDYKSVHDGKTDNSIGTIVEMPRHLVNDNPNQTCSYGLHFCSHEYLKYFSGNRVVILKINPRDVVSIPVDYNNTKGRACRYEVVGELSPEEVKRALDNPVWDLSVVDEYDFDDEYPEYDEDSSHEEVDFNVEQEIKETRIDFDYDERYNEEIFPSSHDEQNPL